MHIFIGADHNGFELKNKLVEYLQEKNIRIEDMGNYELDLIDDSPDFAKKVAQAVLQNPQESLGIVICGSGVGVSITANRYKGIRCALTFDPKQTKDTREDDHANMIAIPAEFVDFEKAKEIVEAFFAAVLKTDEKYMRRLNKMEDV